MSNTNPTPSPAEVSAMLDALQADTWNDDGYLHLDGPNLKFRKREFGGYHVSYHGIDLGWVVQDYETKLWSAYTFDQPAKGRRVEWGCSKRIEAAEFLAQSLSSPRRGTVRNEYVIAQERRYEQHKQFEELMSR